MADVALEHGPPLVRVERAVGLKRVPDPRLTPDGLHRGRVGGKPAAQDQMLGLDSLRIGHADTILASARWRCPSDGVPSFGGIVSAQRSRRRQGFRMFRKRLLGYHPYAVHEALEERDAAVRDAYERMAAAEARVATERAELEARRAEAETARKRIAELEQVSARLATMVVDRDKELRRMRAELQVALERDDGGLRAIAAMARDLEKVRRQAGRQATRLRLRALREAAEVARAIEDLDGAEGAMRERMLGGLAEAIERVGSEDDWADEDDLAARAATNGHVERETGDLFDGLVEVEVGPLSDFSQLVGFEDAASEIGASSEISVKRFTQGRATLAMRFKHPVELLRELEERAPFDFAVRDTRSDRIVLDLDE